MKRFLPILSLFLLTYAVAYLAYEKVMTQPNSYLMDDTMDGLKNYYTLAYYLKYDEGNRFTGMNYPYGEHIVFTDNQPFFAFLFNFVDDNIIPIHQHSVALINVLMMLSIGLGAFFLYLILMHFGIDKWMSVPFAVIIVFLSPQIARTFAHFSLSYFHFIPMLWYFLIQFTSSNKKWIWGSLLFLSQLIFGFLHVYYLLMGAVFMMAYAVVWLLSNYKQFKSTWLQALSLVMIGVLPLIFVQMWVGMTDAATDRVETPYGFFHYFARFKGVFFSNVAPFKEIFKFIFKVDYNVDIEGRSSVGLMGFMVVVFTLIRMLMFIFKKQYHRVIKIYTNPSMNIFFWTSVLVLIFAMCLPFKYGFGWVLNYVPQLKQFRSLGRFGWIFYYLFMVYGAYYTYLVYKSIRMKGMHSLAVSMMSIVLLVWGIEAYGNVRYWKNLRGEFPKENTMFTEAPAYLAELSEKGYDIKDFQSVFVLPYFHVGSEKLFLFRDRYAYDEAVKISYHGGIPVMNNFLSRTSTQQAFSISQLLASDHIQKSVLEDMNDKPVLVMYFKKTDYIDEDEIRFKSSLKKIHETNRFEFFEFRKSDAKTNHESIMTNYNSIKDSLVKVDSEGTLIYTLQPDEYMFKKGFEDQASAVSFRGQGAMQVDSGTYTLFDEVFYIEDSTRQHWELSLWIHLDNKTSGSPNLHYHQFDANGEVVQWRRIQTNQQTELYKDWVKLTFLFKADTQHRQRIILTDAPAFTIDDILLRPVNQPVYWQEEGQLIYNNYTINAD